MEETLATKPRTEDGLDERIERVAAALRERNIEALIVDTGDEAREQALALVPDGAEVSSGKSATLSEIGLSEILDGSGQYDALRPKYMKMDRQTQGDEIRKMIAAPDYMLGSAQAVTEDGALVVVSFSGFQIGPYALGAGKVILVVGSQKIVPDVEAGMRRVREIVTPVEDKQQQAQMGMPTNLNQQLVIYGDPRPGRITVILVKEPVGV
jgi:L-lactate utilization protein LutC